MIFRITVRYFHPFRRLLPFVGLLVFTALAAVDIRAATGVPAEGEGKAVIEIVYDNRCMDASLDSAWGFGCVIGGLEKKILFDCGGEGEILLANMKKLDIDPRSVEVVVISHAHLDHAEGLEKFLSVNPGVKVFVPEEFPTDKLTMIGEKGAKAVTVNKPLKIGPNTWLSGTMGDQIKEHALIIDTESGAVVICGCSHPGIVEVLERSRALTGQNVRMIIGGFHLNNKKTGEVRKIVEQLFRLNVEYAAPSHCTGDEATALFREKFGDRFIVSGLGRKIEINGVDDGR